MHATKIFASASFSLFSMCLCLGFTFRMGFGFIFRKEMSRLLMLSFKQLSSLTHYTHTALPPPGPSSPRKNYGIFLPGPCLFLSCQPLHDLALFFSAFLLSSGGTQASMSKPLGYVPVWARVPNAMFYNCMKHRKANLADMSNANPDACAFARDV